MFQKWRLELRRKNLSIVLATKNKVDEGATNGTTGPIQGVSKVTEVEAIQTDENLAGHSKNPPRTENESDVEMSDVDSGGEINPDWELEDLDGTPVTALGTAISFHFISPFLNGI
jgi:hypothetical protein